MLCRRPGYETAGGRVFPAVISPPIVFWTALMQPHELTMRTIRKARTIETHLMSTLLFPMLMNCPPRDCHRSGDRSLCQFLLSFRVQRSVQWWYMHPNRTTQGNSWRRDKDAPGFFPAVSGWRLPDRTDDIVFPLNLQNRAATNMHSCNNKFVFCNNKYVFFDN